MKGFTAFSGDMTRRYMTVMSEPVRRNNGTIDRYIGDGIMTCEGPPFTCTEKHPGLVCWAALEQLVGPNSPVSSAATR